tara:strand:- start:16946 stop:18679 length:1734 start_codon:yes stop_codon:yes gene_type:complete
VTKTATYLGELHYWRHEPDEWAELLAELRKLGFSGVSSCVPWSVHEHHKGAFAFAKHLNLASFVALAHELGLGVHLRLGPAVGGQLTGFGIPARVLALKECQAVSGRGTPLWLPWPTKMFPAPSFASSAFAAEVGEWFAALGEHLRESKATVSVQCDRRSMGRIAAFDGDYHHDAIAWWQEDNEDVPAPRHFQEDDMPRCLAWVRFGEEYESRAIAWLESAARKGGMALANAAKVGGRASPDSETGDAASSDSERDATTLFIGGAPWFPVVSDDAQKNSVLEALASGITDFTLYMAVARERWAGEARSCEWVGPLLATLREARAHTLRRKTPIVVIANRAEERAAVASCALDSATPAITEWMGLGPSGSAELALDASARLYPRWLAAIREALDLVEVPYLLLGESELHRIDGSTKAVVAPTLRRVDGAVWGALHALGITGMPVVLGPELPIEDELGRPLGDEGGMPQGGGLLAAESLEDIEGLAADVLGLAGELDDLWIAPESPSATCTPFYDEEGQVPLLFVRNRDAAAATAAVNVPVGCTLRDGLTGEAIGEEEGIATLSLAPCETRIFRVEARS